MTVSEVRQREATLLRFLLSTMHHSAPELAALAVRVGSEFEKTEHRVETVDVQARGSVEDAAVNYFSTSSPSH